MSSDGVPKLDPDSWARLARMAEFGVLSASLFHELRQPLFAVKAIAQLAARRGESLDEDGLRQLLVHVVQIEELLDHYAGHNRMGETAVFDLNEAVRRGVDMLEHRARQVRAQVDARYSGAAMVRGRVGALRQVAVNLLHNALDAVDQREDRRVRVSTAIQGASAILEVRDHGPGIPPEVRARLFEPFVTSKPVGRGTGLGLHITRKLVQESGGSLAVVDPDGGGTLIRVKLPLAL